MICDSNNETNFPFKFLLTDNKLQVFVKSLSNNSLRSIKLLKTQFSKILQSEKFICRLYGLLTKPGLLLIKLQQLQQQMQLL